MEIIVLKTLAKICNNYFKRMFDIEIQFDDSSFEMCERPGFNTEILAYIGLAGENHQGQLILGFSKHFSQELVSKYTMNLKDEEKEEFVRSAICEILNNIAGLTASEKAVNEIYPEVSQTLPILNDTSSQGTVYFTKSDGGTIMFTCGEKKMYAFLGLKPFKSIQIKSDDESPID